MRRGSGDRVNQQATIALLADEETSVSSDWAGDGGSDDSGIHLDPQGAAGRVNDGTASRGLTFLDALAILVSQQIGSGIFAAPSQVSQHVASPAVGVLVWLAAGLLVWTGTESFAELGLAAPRNGGPQEYLRICYGDFAASLFTWSWVFMCKGASMAAISSIFASYVAAALLAAGSYHSPSSSVPPPAPSLLAIRVVGLLGLWLITLLNCAGSRSGASAARAFFLLKLAIVAAVTAIGVALVVSGSANTSWFVDSDPGGDDGYRGGEEVSAMNVVADLVTALYGALYCYGGWESVSDIYPLRICKSLLFLPHPTPPMSASKPGIEMPNMMALVRLHHRRYGEPSEGSASRLAVRHDHCNFRFYLHQHLPISQPPHWPYPADGYANYGQFSPNLHKHRAGARPIRRLSLAPPRVTPMP